MTLTERLRQLATAVSDQNWREFSMRDPDAPNPNRDPDIVLNAAADLIEAQAAQLAAGRPRQPKVREVKMACFILDGELRWREEGLYVIHLGIRQPHLDMIAKVPE